MSLWRQFRRGLGALLGRERTDRELTDEVQHYLDEATAALIATGLSPEEALRAARLELGGVTQVRERVRGYGWENLVESVVADLRHAVRRLRAEPGSTAVAVLTVALGIGASTAIFSVVDPILFQPLPYPDADRVVAIWDRGTDGAPAEVTFASYRELRERSRSFEAMAVMKSWQPVLTGTAEPERLDGQRVSWEYFQVLGVAPALGRAFRAEDDVAGGLATVVLGDGLWRRRFGADRGIIGRQVAIGDEPYLVIGVMPPRFENAMAPSAELWAPLQYDLSQGRAWGHHLRLLGRVRAGVELDVARRELNLLAQHSVADWSRQPWASLANGLTVNPLRDDLTLGVRPGLLAVLGAVGLLLVIACVNTAGLLLARGVRRRGEFAVRLALGAGCGRLVRQVLTEQLLLAAAGGAVGLLLARLGVRLLIALSPPNLPRLDAVDVAGLPLLFGIGVTALTGLIFGSMVALQAAREAPQGTLHLASRRSAGGQRRTRRLLVVVQVALALVLLTASGLLWRSLTALFRVESGFASSGLLTMRVQTAGHRFADDGSTARFFAGALEAVRQVPGVTSAAFTSQLPFSGDLDLYGVRFEGNAPVDSSETRGSFRYAVSPGYFEAMGIRLRRGRPLREEDRAGSAPVAVISESMARRRLAGLDPVGQRLRIGDGAAYTVVGVVGDVRQVSLAAGDADAVYISAGQWRFADAAMSLVVRTRGEPLGLAPAIRQAVWSVDPDQPIVRLATMTDLLAASAAERRFALMLFEAFGGVALLLAAAGIYGVLAGSVAERTREIGVRAALGASRRAILGMVLREGMLLTAGGVVVGLIGAVSASRVIATLLFGVSPNDLVTYAGVIILLAGVSLLACGVPAWRAAQVDPVTTLRAE